MKMSSFKIALGLVALCSTTLLVSCDKTQDNITPIAVKNSMRLPASPDDSSSIAADTTGYFAIASMSDLPQPASDFITQNYSQATIAAFEEQQSDPTNPIHFLVILNDGNGNLISVPFDGLGNQHGMICTTPMSSGFTNIAESDLPDRLQNYLDATYPNYEFAMAQNGGSGTTHYIVTIVYNNAEVNLNFDGIGNIQN